MTMKLLTEKIEVIEANTISLRNLEEMIRMQNKRLHTGEYFYKIHEKRGKTFLVKVKFYCEKTIINRVSGIREIRESLLSKSLLRETRNSDKSNREEKEAIEGPRKGKSEATILLLTKKELIEYSTTKRDLKELSSLVKQLEGKLCFTKDEIPKLGLNYREAKQTDNLHLEKHIIEQIFLGALTEYTIEEFFENKANEEILNVSTLPNNDKTGYHIVYEFKNKKLISEDVFDGLKSALLDNALEEFVQRGNIEAFKKKFSIMNN